MIRFDVLPPWPSTLGPSDLGRLGVLLAKSLRLKKDRTVGVRFVGLKEMQELNHRYRGLKRPTDVLSFSASDEEAVKDFSAQKTDALGDLVICPQYAYAEASRRGLPLYEELVRLVIHGTLHLAGYDHAKEADENKMFAKQERLVEEMTHV